MIPSFTEFQRDGVAINDPRYMTILRDVPLIGPTGPPESVPAPEAVEAGAELKKPVAMGEQPTDVSGPSEASDAEAVSAEKAPDTQKEIGKEDSDLKTTNEKDSEEKSSASKEPDEAATGQPNEEAVQEPAE